MAMRQTTSEYAKLILFHELCHQIGALDHYCEGNPCVAAGRCYYHTDAESDKRPQWCIMDNVDELSWTEYWSDLESRALEQILCDACLADINTYLTTNYINE